MDQKAYRALSAAVIQRAVGDVESAYGKVKRWASMEKTGKLERYVAERQAAADSDPDALRLSGDELSALVFFRTSSPIKELHYGMIDMDPDIIPRRLRTMIEFVEDNHEKYKRRIAWYKGQTTRTARNAML